MLSIRQSRPPASAAAKARLPSHAPWAAKVLRLAARAGPGRPRAVEAPGVGRETEALILAAKEYTMAEQGGDIVAELQQLHGLTQRLAGSVAAIETKSAGMATSSDIAKLAEQLAELKVVQAAASRLALVQTMQWAISNAHIGSFQYRNAGDNVKRESKDVVVQILQGFLTDSCGVIISKVHSEDPAKEAAAEEAHNKRLIGQLQGLTGIKLSVQKLPDGFYALLNVDVSKAVQEPAAAK